MWLLFRTISNKPEFARRMKQLDLAVVNKRHTVEVPTGALIMYKSPVAFNMQLCMEEPHIAGVILQHAAEATSLSLQILEADSDGASVRRGDWNGVLTQGLRRMFPSFDTQTAHLQYPTMLQKLETLYFHGDEFHWVLARSPFLFCEISS
jgi:hypothetical protein